MGVVAFTKFIKDYDRDCCNAGPPNGLFLQKPQPARELAPWHDQAKDFAELGI